MANQENNPLQQTEAAMLISRVSLSLSAAANAELIVRPAEDAEAEEYVSPGGSWL
jgi:hypothetical protein